MLRNGTLSRGNWAYIWYVLSPRSFATHRLICSLERQFPNLTHELRLEAVKYEDPRLPTQVAFILWLAMSLNAMPSETIDEDVLRQALVLYYKNNQSSGTPRFAHPII